MIQRPINIIIDIRSDDAHLSSIIGIYVYVLDGGLSLFCTTLSSTVETYILVLEPKSWFRLTLTSSFGIEDVCVMIVPGINNMKKKYAQWHLLAFDHFMG